MMTVTNQLVAVKCVVPGHGTAQCEVQIMRRLVDNDNILKLFDHYTAPNGNLMLEFEFCDLDLGKYLRAHGPLDQEIARGFMRQILTGVAACHSSGVIHRDLKPDVRVMSDEWGAR